mmetsp:Transcript_9158/g.35823  ORF Transcript_9158/g.35823 Transcript_9158/m.35823 type:complete len:229 (-) Transcript_9158:898-1584(-)
MARGRHTLAGSAPLQLGGNRTGVRLARASILCAEAGCPKPGLAEPLRAPASSSTCGGRRRRRRCGPHPQELPRGRLRNAQPSAAHRVCNVGIRGQRAPRRALPFQLPPRRLPVPGGPHAANELCPTATKRLAELRCAWHRQVPRRAVGASRGSLNKAVPRQHPYHIRAQRLRWRRSSVGHECGCFGPKGGRGTRHPRPGSLRPSSLGQRQRLLCWPMLPERPRRRPLC